MKKFLLATLIFSFALGSFLISPQINRAEHTSVEGNTLEIHFFYSQSCPHCVKEEFFLNDIEKEYSQVEINRYPIEDSSTHELLFELAEKHNAERYLGSVPMTFVEEDFFLGFDNRNGIGEKIENSIKRQLEPDGKGNGQTATSTNGITNVEDKIDLPLVGEINPGNYSLPALSVLLGFLDGFNICSLGALVLILGLVITLRSRKKILGLGGIFIITTVLIYGLLIVLWYQLFSALSSAIGAITAIVGLLAIFGGIFFLSEFRQYKKYGPTCNTAGNRLVSKLSARVQKAFQSKKGFFALAGIIFAFAAAITIVEFPCSAAVPVVFAGILAEQSLSAFGYLFYITLFVLFYMLDELIVFFIAVWKMDVWMASPKFVTWATLIEGLILLLLGGYYLLSLL